MTNIPTTITNDVPVKNQSVAHITLTDTTGQPITLTDLTSSATLTDTITAINQINHILTGKETA